MLAGGMACTTPTPAPPTEGVASAPSWRPGVVYATPRTPGPRGLLDRRGLIHAHSAYSHDACDGEPVDPLTGLRDARCLADFRAGLCAAQHDFVFLTDHGDSFADVEFEQALLLDEGLGDVPIIRQGAPVASWVACPEGNAPLLVPGTETALMPVGLARHPVPVGERRRLYGSNDADARRQFREAGALVLQAHTERFSADEVIAQDLDGFEMYNLHANLMAKAGVALELLVRVQAEDPWLPAPDLFLLPFLAEDERTLLTWSQVLARGERPVTTLGTDCHRNSFPALLADGERADSYRRMMLWFSNHILVAPEADGSWDERHLMAGLAAGRLYGAFEVFGYPEGFDFFAQSAGEARADTAGGIVEMGGAVTLEPDTTLEVVRPRVASLSPESAPPQLTLRLLRATEEGWQEVARSDADRLRHRPAQPGAYRAEVRIVPHHLDRWMGTDDWNALATEHPWIYSNAIYVMADDPIAPQSE